MFSIKLSRNLLGQKHDLTMVTFNSWTDTHQILAAPNSDLENWKSGSTFLENLILLLENYKF